MQMNKVAFYVMNSKGYYILEKFIKQFGKESVEYVVSNTDKHVRNDFFEEIRTLAGHYAIPFYQKNDDYKNHETVFEGYRFAIGWRWIIEKTDRLIIFHDSLLPKYRGFAPLVNALINKEPKIGVTALFATNEYDKGDILAQESIRITYPITIEEAIAKIQPLYYKLICNIYLKIKERNILNSTKQNEELASYSLWLDDKDYFVDWSWSADKIKRFIDAVGYPFDGAKAYLNNNIVILANACVLSDVYVEHRERHIGKIIFFDGKAPVVVCKEGLLEINDIRNIEDKKIKVSFRSRFS
jgi:methionyl-tRNA formyltransferase